MKDSAPTLARVKKAFNTLKRKGLNRKRNQRSQSSPNVADDGKDKVPEKRIEEQTDDEAIPSSVVGALSGASSTLSLDESASTLCEEGIKRTSSVG